MKNESFQQARDGVLRRAGFTLIGQPRGRRLWAAAQSLGYRLVAIGHGDGRLIVERDGEELLLVTRGPSAGALPPPTVCDRRDFARCCGTEGC